MADQDVDERGARDGVLTRARGEGLGRAEDRGHRRAQLVRGVGNEVAAKRLPLALNDDPFKYTFVFLVNFSSFAVCKSEWHCRFQ